MVGGHQETDFPGAGKVQALAQRPETRLIYRRQLNGVLGRAEDGLSRAEDGLSRQMLGQVSQP